jgi:serine protease Do
MRRRSLLLLALLFALPAAPAARAAHGPGDEALDELQRRIIQVAEQVKPCVVHVEAIAKIDDRRTPVTGSGFIVSPDGTILTNHHVVDRAEKVTVSVPGRKPRYPARIVGMDKQTDLAVLKIEPESPLPAAKLGRADTLQVGQWVLAVGNPYGLDGTVSFGIISAKGRNLEVDDLLNDFIQTDAMIDVGSSGGPLVDLDGEVVGINSRGQGRGIGFTIPIDTAVEVMRQIHEGGVERGWLGITMQALDRDLARYFGVPDASGVVVNSVVARSPAAQAGLEPGDIVTAFDGAPVEAEKEDDLGAFQRRVARQEPGHRVRLDFLRNGKPRHAEVVIAEQPKVEPAEAESPAGFHVQEITESMAREQRLASRRGAFVSFVARGSPANEAGLLPGDVIERIEKSDVSDLDTFRRSIATVEKKPVFLITARRGSETKFLLVKQGAAELPSSPSHGEPPRASQQPPPPAEAPGHQP